MAKIIDIEGKPVGPGQPTYIIAEVGINHNGELNNAIELIDKAVEAGCDAVKFQKRDPDIAVPEHQRDVMRETPWGEMTYLEYKKRIEFGQKEFEKIDAHCRNKGITWFASAWDEGSVDFLEAFDPPCYKVASASLTHESLLRKMNEVEKPIMLSTGMSTMDEIRHAASLIDDDRLLIAHATSTYPCANEELNLRMIQTLQKEFDIPIGYSGHELGLQVSYAAVALGACFLERHITLDRAMWGTDQAASVEPGGFKKLVRDIRVIEKALGDGVKKVYDSELPIRKKLRGE